jgi:hypothetical protein
MRGVIATAFMVAALLALAPRAASAGERYAMPDCPNSLTCRLHSGVGSEFLDATQDVIFV